MVVRIVIAGSRGFFNYKIAEEYIDFCLQNLKDRYQIIILSGTCNNSADKLGERYAKERGYAVEKYPANWSKFGRAAGPVRNYEMAEKADYVICFWDGKSPGTKSLIRFARQLHKPVRIKMVEDY